MSSKPAILLCAGGTGGHLFPAQAVAWELKSRGYEIHLAADERVDRFAGDFPAKEIHTVKSASIGSKNPFKLVKSLFGLMAGYRQSMKLLNSINPVAAIGFGGYPTVPPIFAASRYGIPTMVHEANAVPGRANKLLFRFVRLMAIGFGSAYKGKNERIIVTGNPVRPPVLEASNEAYPDRNASDPFNLLIFGGSQGAAYFGEIVPKACALLDSEIRKRLRLTLQARPEDIETVRAEISNVGITAEIESFYGNMAERIAKAHLVMSRSGASTVSELSVIGRPSILIPYPYALDHDQAMNAKSVEKAGGAQVIAQSDLTAKRLASEITAAINEPKRLATAAKNAKKTGIANASVVVADCIEQLINEQ